MSFWLLRILFTRLWTINMARVTRLMNTVNWEHVARSKLVAICLHFATIVTDALFQGRLTLLKRYAPFFGSQMHFHHLAISHIIPRRRTYITNLAGMLERLKDGFLLRTLVFRH